MNDSLNCSIIPDLRCMSKPFLIEFLELYKSKPCLWKVKSKEYHDRNKKTSAYEELIAKLREIDPEADRDMVCRKINSLRSSYRKEKKKIQASKKSTSDPDDIYTPKLWYYYLLEFLDDQEFAEPTVSIYEDIKTEGSEHLSLSDVDLKSPIECQSPEPEMFLPTSHLQDPFPTNKFKKHKRDEHNMVSSTGRQMVDLKLEDQSDVFGKYIAFKLREISSDQRIFLEKIINDAIYEAQLGNLNEHCQLRIPSLRDNIDLLTQQNN